MSGSALPRRAHFTWHLLAHARPPRMRHQQSRTVHQTDWGAHTTLVLPERRGLASESFLQPLSAGRKLCRSPISPVKWQADRRGPRKASAAFPGAPPNPAPARLLPETSENPPSESRPLLGARNELGMSQRAAGRPSQPCVQPVTPASPQPAPRAVTAARGPAQDPTRRLPWPPPPPPQPEAPWRGTRSQVPAPPLQLGPSATPSAPLARPRGLGLPPSAARPASLLHWAGAPRPHAGLGPWCPAGPR